MGFVSFPCPKRPPQTMHATLIEAGMTGADKESDPDLWRRQQIIVAGLEGPIFFCGTIPDLSNKCRCGHDADFLCDMPVGRGKTCDLALCYCCALLIGPDFHLCPFHRATYKPRRPFIAHYEGMRLVGEDPDGR